jgi:HPt (histidine-containing phosphotransfer) domain-containing protein
MNTPTTPNAAVDGIIDRAEILERFEGDWDLVREVIGLFLEDCPHRLCAVRDALAAGDCDALQRAAHSLKGSVSNFSASDAVQAALRLEMIGRGGDLAEAVAASAALEREIARLTPVLAHLIAEADAGGDHVHANC